MKFDSLKEKFIYLVNKSEALLKAGYLNEAKKLMDEATQVKKELDLEEAKSSTRK